MAKHWEGGGVCNYPIRMSVRNCVILRFSRRIRRASFCFDYVIMFLSCLCRSLMSSLHCRRDNERKKLYVFLATAIQKLQVRVIRLRCQNNLMCNYTEFNRLNLEKFQNLKHVIDTTREYRGIERIFVNMRCPGLSTVM